MQNYINYLSLGFKIYFNNKQSFFFIKSFVEFPLIVNTLKQALMLPNFFIEKLIRCQKVGFT